MSAGAPAAHHRVAAAAALACALLPVFVASDAVQRAAALAASAGGGAYYVAGHTMLLFVVLPLVTLSAFILFLLPGVLLASSLGKTATTASTLFYGFICSLLVVSLMTGAVQGVTGEALGGRAYAVVLGVGAALIALVLRWRRGPAWLAMPRGEVALRQGLLFGLFPLALYYVLAPKLLWESFNGDGAHAFESSRLLLRHALPFWPPDAGPVAGFPGMTSMLFAFPNAWFLRLFGETEYAVRAPFLLYLPVLAAGILVVAAAGTKATTARLSVLAGVLASLACYAMAMAFSATYNPYSADIALPATQDTLLMIVYLLAIAAAVNQERVWLAAGIVLTYVSLPSGLLLIGFWIAARLLAERPRRWREAWIGAGLLVVTILVVGVMPRVLAIFGAPPPGSEYGLTGILRYFAFLQFTDASRLVYLALPAGIFPLLMAFAWRRQDWVARALTFVAGAYFLFFFVQAHVSLHHFVPAMILPVVVAARIVADPATAPRAATRTVFLWSGLAAIALVFVMPRPLVVHDTGRRIGATISERLGDYASSDPAVLRGSSLLAHLFPLDWDPAVPGSSYGGSPLVWNRYATHASEPGPETNYLLTPSTSPSPSGWRLVVDTAGHALYVKSDSVWERHRTVRPPTPAGSRWLAVPRSILFRSVPHDGSPAIIDVAATLEALGVDVDPILARLGVRRDP